LFEQLVAADAVAGLFSDQDNCWLCAGRRLFEKIPRRLLGPKQGLDLFAHFRLVPAGLGRGNARVRPATLEPSPG
jgi:hypothetical protein